MQSWPSSDVLFNWIRTIDHFAANDTQPLNVTAIDTADIVSTLQVVPVASPIVCDLFCSTAQRAKETHEAFDSMYVVRLLFCPHNPALGCHNGLNSDMAVLQLQGKNLVPFTFDKQALFLQTARNLFP